MTRSHDAAERLQEVLCQLALIPREGEAMASIDASVSALLTGIDSLYAELDATTLDRERVEDIFDAMSDVVLVVDREGRITRANLRAQQLLGYTKDELLQMRLSDIVV